MKQLYSIIVYFRYKFIILTTDLNIKATDKTPEVICSHNGFISIKGISIPENAFNFYAGILKWLENYTKQGKVELKVVLYFTYCNTSTYQMLGAFLRLISDASAAGISTAIEWQFDEGDMDMEDIGHDYAKIYSNLDFKVLEVK